MKAITYCYPLFQNVSFKIIAEKHIEYLQRKYVIRKVDVNNIRFLKLLPTNYVIFHPLFYPLWYCWDNDYELNYQMLKFKNTLCEKLVAFDTADSDRISDKAVNIANYLPDTIVLPSKFSAKAYIRSGVKPSKIRVIPHGVSNVFFEDKVSIKTPELYKIWKYEKKKKILYFCIHSWFRKGADIVEKAISKLREKRKDFILICKCSNLKYELEYARRMCDYVITKFMNEVELKTLYDICDMLLLPSRGGGFELNGLEALMRDKPIIYPKTSCVEEYAGKIIPELGVEIADNPIVLPKNKIHIGRGHEVNLEDFIEKTSYCLDNLQYFKEKVKTKFTREEKEKYKWENIVKQIIEVIEK